MKGFKKTKHMRSAGGVVLEPGGKILLVTQRNGTCCFPKGNIEPHESRRNAARRETSEESGLTHPKLLFPLEQYARHKTKMGGGEESSTPKILTMYLFVSLFEKPNPQSHEIKKAEWVNLSVVVRRLSNPRDKKFLRSSLWKIREVLRDLRSGKLKSGESKKEQITHLEDLIDRIKNPIPRDC